MDWQATLRQKIPYIIFIPVRCYELLRVSGGSGGNPTVEKGVYHNIIIVSSLTSS